MLPRGGGPRAARRRAERRRSGERRALAWAGRLLALAAVFVLGIALGRALEESSTPSGTQTLVRTLDPGTLAPLERTVTVTVSE